MTETAAAFDVNDSSTWPTDTEELAKLADNAASPSQSADDYVPITDKTSEIESEVADPMHVGGALHDDESPVLAKDGKHLIPFQVVADLRAEVEKLKQEKAQLAPVEQQQPPAEIPIHLRTQEEIDAFIDEFRDTYGDAMADLQLDAILTKRQMAVMQYERQQEHDARLRMVEAQQQQTLQQAIEANPLMKAWQADDKSDWYAKANKQFQLLGSDPEFQSLSPAEQINQVANITEARYGKSPHSTKVSTASQRKPAKDPSADFMPRVPTSMSELPGGAPVALDVADQFEAMSGAALTNHLMSLKGDALQKELARLL
jgi:hypothetical protein